MEHERFRDWFSRVDELTAAQRKELVAVLSDPPEGAASLAAIELGVDDERRCPHCGDAAGRCRAARRAACAGSGARSAGDVRSAHGHGAVGLHHKERWLAFGASLAEGETIKESPRCGIAPSTAHRWRHRFLAAVRQAPDRLAGIVEADETFVLESRKGERKLDRKPRRRGGKARKRGLSREQVPILVAADRGGETLSHTARSHGGQREAGCWSRSSPRTRCSSPTPTAATARRGGARHPSREHQRLCWRAGPGRCAHPDGQQPSQPDQALPARAARHRPQVPRQLSEVVPSHRTRRPAIAQGLS